MQTIKAPLCFSISILLMSSFASISQTISQRCILINVAENGQLSKSEYELWDIYLDASRKTFMIKAVSFVERDVSLLPEHGKCWNTYVWQHESKSITKNSANSFDIVTDGRMSNFDMNIQLTIDGKYSRIASIVATLPIGTEGEDTKQFRINRTDANITISPLYNSAYKAE